MTAIILVGSNITLGIGTIGLGAGINGANMKLVNTTGTDGIGGTTMTK